MQFTLALATWLLLQSPVTAFYPYTPPWGKPGHPTKPRAALGEAEGLAAPGSITLPLHRTPIRRDNNYNILPANTPTQSDSVAIDQDGNDYTYFSSMSFGDSPIQFHMLMDTAASNTWVMSSECTALVCQRHNTLGPEKSTTLVKGTGTFAITYGTGNVNGTIVTDTAHFAGNDVKLTFGLASGVSDEFGSYALDGILGFGRGIVGEQVGSPSIIELLAAESLISAKVIGVHLARADNPPNDGQMNLGAPNPSLYDGDLHYISALNNNRGFWEIPIEDAGVDGAMTGITGQTAIIDTGTSFMLLPPAAAKTLHAKIPNSAESGEGFTVPCSSTQPVQIVFGGNRYNISATDYVGGNAGNGACHSNIIGRRTFEDYQWLMGDVFLKNVYTVFDYDQARVGFGVKERSTPESTEPVATSTSQSTEADSTSAPIPLVPGSTTTTAGSETQSMAESDSAAQTQSTSPSNTSMASEISTPALFSIISLLSALLILVVM